MFSDVILSEAKNLALKRINDLRDPSSPSAPQDDTLGAFFSNLLDSEKLIAVFRLLTGGLSLD